MIFNPFFKKKDLSPPPEAIITETSDQIITEDAPTRPVPTRGPGGKFVSKASTDSAVVSKKQSQPVKKEEIKTGVLFNSSTFGGVPIRRFYSKNKWFFCIEDIITLSGVPQVKKYFQQLKNKNEEMKKNWDTMIKKFEDQTEKSSGELECTDAENVRKIILLFDKPLPGPFSRWLRETSQKNPA